MSKKNPPSDQSGDSKPEQPTSDRHKPGARLVRIRPQLVKKLEAMAERDVTDITELVNRAVRELLEREGLHGSQGETTS